MDFQAGRAPLVSVVVLSWNRKGKLDRCLKSLARLEYANLEVYVVDNGSTEFDVRAIPSLFKGVRLIQNGLNLGVSAGKNAVLRRLLADERSEYILFLDDDTVVHPRLVKRLVEVHDPQRGWDILQPAIYEFDRPEHLHAYGGRYLRYRGSAKRVMRLPKPQDPTDEAMTVDFAWGCGLFTHRSVFDSIGLFDEAFSPTYGEDIDFCLRAGRRQYGTVVVPDAILWRDMARGGTPRSPHAAFLLAEKRVFLMKKHARWRHWIPYVIFAPVVSGLAALREVVRGRPGAGIALVRGLARGLLRSLPASGPA